MKTFEHHQNSYNISYVLGNYCRNGCQVFHKDQTQELFDQYDVPEEYREDIMEAFSDEEIPPANSQMSEIEKKFYLKLGRWTDIVTLISDVPESTKIALVKLNIGRVLDLLVHDESSAVRKEVAQCKHQRHLEILAKDPDDSVRTAVARIHNKSILDILVHDKY